MVTQLHSYTVTQLHRYTVTQLHSYTGTQLHSIFAFKEIVVKVVVIFSDFRPSLLFLGKAASLPLECKVVRLVKAKHASLLQLLKVL
jgi:hypothetical protein